MNLRLMVFVTCLAAAGSGLPGTAPPNLTGEAEPPGLQGKAQRSRVRGGAARAEDPVRVILPPDSPQLDQLKTDIVRLFDAPVDEVIAPGRIDFDVNRVARILLPMAGRIARVGARLGDAVAAGQALLEIESPEAEGAIAEWRQATAGVAQAQASLTKATADHERMSDLLAHRAVAQKDLLAAELALAEARGNLEQSRAALQQARRRLEILGLDPESPDHRLVVRAPIAGKVIDLAVTPGEYRSDTSIPLLTVADLSQVWVTSEVPEKSIRLVEPGEKVEVTLVSYPGEVFTARVARIADTVDPKTRTIRVQAVLPNPRGRLRPEMYGTIRHAHGRRPLPAVPAAAVVHWGSETVVFVERDRGVFDCTPVRLGNALEDLMTVLEGVQAGDRIVVAGAMLLLALAGK